MSWKAYGTANGWGGGPAVCKGSQKKSEAFFENFHSHGGAGRAERVQVKCKKIADYKKARQVLERVKAPHVTYTPKEEKVHTFLLKGLDAEEQPDEVLKILQETGTVGKFFSVSRFSTKRSVWEKRILSHFLVQISPEIRGSDLIDIGSFNPQATRFERLLKSEIA